MQAWLRQPEYQLFERVIRGKLNKLREEIADASIDAVEQDSERLVVTESSRKARFYRDVLNLMDEVRTGKGSSDVEFEYETDKVTPE